MIMSRFFHIIMSEHNGIKVDEKTGYVVDNAIEVNRTSMASFLNKEDAQEFLQKLTRQHFSGDLHNDCDLKYRTKNSISFYLRGKLNHFFLYQIKITKTK